MHFQTPRTALALVLAIAAAALAALIAPASSLAGAYCDSPDPPPVCPGEPRGFFSLGYQADPQQQRGALDIVVRGAIVEGGVDYYSGTPIYVYADAQPAIKLTDYGDGFETTITAGTRRVCVYSRMPRGQQYSVSLGCKSPNVTPFGALDAVTLEGSQVRVRGWTIDPETSSPIDVHVYADGEFAAGVRADQEAPQAGASRTAIWGSRHGFDSVLPASTTKGEHSVCAYAINAGAGDMNPQLGCGTYVVVGPPNAPSGTFLSQPAGERHSTISVSWLDHADDEREFRIVRTRNGYIEPDGPRVGQLTGTGRRGERIDGGLVPGSRYCYRVIAINDHGASAPSDEACLTTLQPPLAAATALTVMGRTTSSVTLAWSDNAADETGNRVVAERSDTGSRSIIAVGPLAGTGRRTTEVSGLASGKEYCLTVVVERTGHENSVSERACVRTKAAGAYLLSLSRQSPTSLIYGADAINDWGIPDGAVITTVKNTSGYTYSLAHGGVGSQYLVLGAGETTSAFAGGLVKQEVWSAQYSGNANWAPSSLGVTVSWVEP